MKDKILNLHATHSWNIKYKNQTRFAVKSSLVHTLKAHQSGWFEGKELVLLEFHDIAIDVSIIAPNLVTFEQSNPEKIGEVLQQSPLLDLHRTDMVDQIDSPKNSK